MGRKKAVNNDAVPVALEMNPNDHEITETKIPRFVVVRDGHRVSLNEYEDPKDPKALEEIMFWRGISKKQSWGESVRVVPYDNKLHRVW